MTQNRFVEIQFKDQKRAYYLNPEDTTLAKDSYVLVEGEPGLKIGKVLRNVKADVYGERADTLKKILRAAEATEIENFLGSLGKQESAARACQEQITMRNLEMKLINVDVQFDGAKITFFFTAERRVDFRELVRALAGIFKTRIELRQVGVRDEAKSLDGVGPCGKRLCCSSWLKDFAPITLKMARDQHISLTPSKISGMCGRLLCCLEYEHEIYLAKSKLFPPIGSRVTTMDGKQMLVTNLDIFRERVICRNEVGAEFQLMLADIKEKIPPDPRRRRDTNADEDGDYIPDRE